MPKGFLVGPQVITKFGIQLVFFIYLRVIILFTCLLIEFVFQWNWFVYQKTQKKISDNCSTGHEAGQGKSDVYTT